ncbi:hypothetical protein PG993_015198 [Apiospora rasikravindrae]|uniref:F-box domain-containing protein n=1 Tax=Apiospora rasikravindrae TaxID=990691 RepID=A0ABR1RPV8_9PEZI
MSHLTVPSLAMAPIPLGHSETPLTITHGKTLPAEVIMMILEQIDGSQRPTCASVCKSWQAVVERSTFNKLVLEPIDLFKFIDIIQRHRPRHLILKHVVFCVPMDESFYFVDPPEPADEDTASIAELLEYDRTVDKNDHRHERQRRIFREAIPMLFAALNTFNNNDLAFRLDLTIIGTDSVQRKRAIQQQGLNEWHILELESSCSMSRAEFEESPWVQFYSGGRSIMPTSPASFNDMNWDTFIISNRDGIRYRALPTVQAVTDFRVSCQCLHYIPDISRSVMMRSFPNLKHVAFEKWHEERPCHWRGDLIRLDWFGAMLPNWSQSLKSIYLYQVPFDIHSDEDDHAHMNVDLGSIFGNRDTEASAALGWKDNSVDLLDWTSGWRPTMRKLTDRILPQHLALRSRGMEELGICNIIDGKRFFAAFKQNEPLPLWPDLRLLTLTASLKPGVEDENGQKLLQGFLKRLPEFVNRMPKLQTLELYEADDKGAALLQYSRSAKDGGRATVRWFSTWPLVVDNDVKTAWESIASEDGYSRVEFLPEEVVGVYKGPADFVATYLLTRDKIMDPETLREQVDLEMVAADIAS